MMPLASMIAPEPRDWLVRCRCRPSKPKKKSSKSEGRWRRVCSWLGNADGRKEIRKVVMAYPGLWRNADQGLPQLLLVRRGARERILQEAIHGLVGLMQQRRERLAKGLHGLN